MSKYIDGTWLKAFFEADKGKGRTTPIDSLLALIDDAPTAECFTCGMERVKDEKYGSLPTLVYDPENVPDNVLEANDRLVSLADVCKLIKREWQLNPHQWGELARLPSINLVRCKDCEECFKYDDGLMCMQKSDYSCDVEPDDFCSYGKKAKNGWIVYPHEIRCRNCGYTVKVSEYINIKDLTSTLKCPICREKGAKND